MFSSNSSQVSSDANYIEDCFSTYLYTGNGNTAPETQTINNGIDLSGKGGLVWIKNRSVATNNVLFDTARGATKVLVSNATSAESTDASTLTSFNNNGFSVYYGQGVNAQNNGLASWTFREQPKFFDVVTYTGTGSPVTVNHNLGSTPGCIIIKATSNTGNWHVWHRSVVDGSGYGYLVLNTTDATAGGKIINSTSSTDFVVSTGMSDVGYTYVCYVFAHDAGGFGLTGTDNVISCGSFTVSGSTATVNLGYEPQWVMIKSTDETGSGWEITDNMRAMPVVGSSSAVLYANLSNAESSSIYGVHATATGFVSNGYTSGNFIYIAIRRGPMKVPTSGTSVFAPIAQAAGGTVTTNFPVDLIFSRKQSVTYNTLAVDRLRGSSIYSLTNTTAAEANAGSALFGIDSNTGYKDNQYAVGDPSPIFWNFRRAPSFFDEVCFTQSDYTQAYTHNLTVVPEMMIVKRRNNTSDWSVYSAALGNTKYLKLQDTGGEFTGGVWGNTSPTSTQFTFSGAGSPNTYVAYLFATCAGVSKVGSYTGTGTTKQVDCGFTGGARFVLIKRTDSTGDWYVWDTARGIVSGNDPYLLLNSTAAETTGTDYIDTYSAGFEISSTAPAAINASGGTFIFLAIA